MRRFTFHVGPHKMATTFLQKSVRTALKRKQSVDELVGYTKPEHPEILYVSPSQPFVRTFRDSLTQAYRKGDPALARQAANAFFDGVVKPLDEYKNVVLINENFIGPQLGQGMAWDRIYPNSQINSVFHQQTKKRADKAGIDYRIALSIREQTGFIESSYLNVVRDSGRYVTFATYRKKYNEEKMLWSVFIDTYVNKLGGEAVQVIPYELISHGVQEFMDRFCAVFFPGISLPAVDERVRESFSAAALDIVAELCPEGGETPVPREVVLALLTHLPKGKFGAPVLFSPEEKRAYRDRYVDDNRAIFERYVSGKWEDVFKRAYA